MFATLTISKHVAKSNSSNNHETLLHNDSLSGDQGFGFVGGTSVVVVSSCLLVIAFVNFLSNPLYLCYLFPQMEGNLRGAEVEDSEHRDLLSAGGTSTALAFSFASSAGAADFCIDYYADCIELGYVSVYTDADADAASNTFAFAYSTVNLWLEAYCGANAFAYAQACAFTKVDGKVKVDIATNGSQKTVGLSIQLTSASTSYALATSAAVADSYAAVGAQSFTTVVAFCTAVKNKSPLCAGGTASTDLEQVAIASAGSFSDAVAVSGAGGFGKAKASVYVDGSSINNVSGHLVAIAKSWAFASAEASAEAYSVAITEIINSSFTAVCIQKHGEICGASGNKGKGVCGSTPEVACASAYSYGQAYAAAFSFSFASIFIKACAEAAVIVILKAAVNCAGTPVFLWTASQGGAEVSC